MDNFYKYKKTNPIIAENSLIILLNQDKKYKLAIKELIEFYLENNNNKNALPWLLKLHELAPNNPRYTYKLAYTQYALGNWGDAKLLFEEIITKKSKLFKNKAVDGLKAMQSYLLNYKSYATYTSLISKQNKQLLLTESKQRPSDLHKIQPKFYKLKNTPNTLKNNLEIFKNKGFAAIKKNKIQEAIYYFKKAYQISHQPEIAMQLGYLYTCINQNPLAYQYFQWASQSKNHNLALSAENAMTNLAGLQTKALPKPYFAETFFTPFSQSRFGLTVRPFLTRFGIEQNNKLATREYLFLRRTDDNKSQSLGEISQIYEDDVQIEGVGAQVSPIAGLPIVGYIETGIAYDLVYRNRKRFRGDLRGGFMYYDQFGVKPAYYDKVTLGLFYFGDLYGDATYFTRYDNNVIGGIRTHHGVRLIQYHSMILNTYLTGRVITDTKRLFYNNFLEGGPGVAFIPTNRFNFQLRFEHLNGAYIPAGAIPNPYRQYYTNNLVQLLFYVKI